MHKKTIMDIDIRKKTILVRVDFNVPRDREGNILDDTRIREALPTISYLLASRAKVILISHLGRPKGQVEESLRLDKVAEKLSELLEQKVLKMDNIIGPEVKEKVAKMDFGEVILLENIRFHPGEPKNDLELARELASLAEIYVNEAFGTSHREHSSTAGVAKYLPAVSGFLVEKELSILGNVADYAERPFAAIIGGAKVSDKIGVIENLITKVDSIIIGGGMANTFLKAKGYEIGNSLVEEDKLELAQSLIAKAKRKQVGFFLPIDLVVADSIENPQRIEIVRAKEIPEGMMALDIGPETRDLFRKALYGAKTIFWNGPMGVFEKEEFSEGTEEMARNVASSSAYSIVGGGDSVAAIRKVGLVEKINHISTGGGASLKFLEGEELPGVRILLDK